MLQLVAQVQQVENRHMAASNDFPKFTPCELSQVPTRVLEDVKRVARMDGVSFDNIYYSYKDSVVVRLVLSLELPTRYDEATALVRAEEPVCVEFFQDYPDRVPRVFIGRNDFDFDHTPHIYVEKDGMRPICLFRGNGDEWFANMEIEDFIKHLRSWYEDLASGVNIEDGGEFEPLRLEGYTATMSYDYEQLSDEIDEADGQQEVIPLFIYHRLEKKLVRLTNKNGWLLNLPGVEKKDVILGSVCRDCSKRSCDTYDIVLPRTYSELIDYSHRHGVEIETTVNGMLDKMDDDSSSIVVVLAIKRSKKLIGVNSFYQFVNFEIICDTDTEGKKVVIPTSTVNFHKHESPLTTKKAHEISNLDSEIDPSLIVAGCGALGSKIAMHLVRSGITNILFCDPDYMSEHNLCRHVLLDNSVIKNKASEMKNATNLIYFHELFKADATNRGIKKILEDTVVMSNRKPDYLLDFTASKVVQNQLVNIGKRPTAISAAIYDNGKFGLLMCEGSGGGVRLDDLLATVFAQYKTDPFVSDYLMRERGIAQEPTTLLNVGLGCNSETFILADDVISLYAASMSITIKDIFAGNHADGGCWMYMTDADGGLKVRKIDVPQIYCYDMDTWKVRISDQVVNEIVEQTETAGCYETGGYLIGQCNLKTNTIHVIDTIEAPEDTIHRGDYLVLGKKGVRKKLSQIERRSGVTFGYVGEWHSHPNGPNWFSVVDFEEFAIKAEEMRAEGATKPILEVLVTPVGMKCAVLALGEDEAEE